jgi:tetratricopeptide (TPR) repeat protein
MARAPEACRCLALVLAWLALSRPLDAQLPQAEDAFRRGDYAAARAAYEHVLASDSLNVSALYRLAILDSWDGKLARSLERFARLRRLAPRDEDIMVSQAAVLGWAGQAQWSRALYDSVLAHSPQRADALAGRARAVAWSGDLERAERLWRAGLAVHPDDPELLVGLAQTLYWRGRPALAATYAARARVLAPRDPTALDLERAVRAAVRPEVQTTIDGAGDSEDNDFVAQKATFATSLGGDRRGTLHAGWRRATLGARAGTSYGGSGEVIAALGNGAVVHAGLGLERLESGSAATTPLTAQVGVDFRLARHAAASVDYGRTAFDETALLIERGFVIDALDLGVDISPSATWSISGSGGGAWLSDGNRRYTGASAVLASVLPGLQLGPSFRILGYRADLRDGYWAPNRFTVIEAQVVYTLQRSGWGVRADGGLGSQQVSNTAAHQVEWHLGLTLSRSWGANNEIALVGSITNSARTTTAVPTEAFRSRTLGLRFRQGL